MAVELQPPPQSLTAQHKATFTSPMNSGGSCLPGCLVCCCIRSGSEDGAPNRMIPCVPLASALETEFMLGALLLGLKLFLLPDSLALIPSLESFWCVTGAPGEQLYHNIFSVAYDPFSQTMMTGGIDVPIAIWSPDGRVQHQ